MRKCLSTLLLVIFVLLDGSLSFAQKGFKVSGTVTDTQGEPIVGVSVVAPANKQGTITDVDGNYTILAASGTSVLQFSFMGYKTLDYRLSGDHFVSVTLEEDAEVLENALVVGAYGTKQRREDMVGSAFQVNSSELKYKPKARVDNLLEGLVPGMSVENTSDSGGNTRDRLNVRIRGQSSLYGSSAPLWVVDGVPMYTGGATGLMPGVSQTVSPLGMLDPNDIESITVLKDADQTTIYGANAAGGVILVTTKKGAAGNEPLKLSATLNYGVSMPDKSTMVKMMNAEQYMEVAKEAWTNAGNLLSNFPYQDNYYNSYSTTSTDWFDTYIGTGSTLYASLSATTGTKRAKTYVTGSYYRNANIVKEDLSERYYVRMNNTYTPRDNFKLGLSLGAILTDDDMFQVGHTYLDIQPIFSPYLEDGKTYRLYNNVWDDVKGTWVMQKFNANKLPEREYNQNNQKSVKTTLNVDMDWEIIKGLKVTSTFEIDYQHSHEDVYNSRKTLSGINDSRQPRGYSSKYEASYTNWTNVNKISYEKAFGKHKLMAYAGLEMHEVLNKSTSASGNGFMSDNVREIQYADESTRKGSSSYNISRTMSYFARTQYSYNSRYYLSANFRRDGSSGFSIYQQWNNFWSVGGSWNIHKEPFFHVDWIKMLKLKGSFGIVGNSRVDNSYKAGTYTYSNSYSYGDSAGAVLSAIPTEGLTWETVNRSNVGLAFNLGGIIEGEVEYYHNLTKDMISKIYVSRMISDDRIYANVGSMQNTGFELNLTSHNIRTSDFSWTTTLNATHNENKILELHGDMTTGFNEYLYAPGYDSHTWYLVKWAGVDPADGMPMWYDKEGNVTKTFSYDNRQITGLSRTPVVYGGLVNSFTWKNLSFSFQINYNIGGWDLPSYASRYFDDGYSITSGNQAVETYLYRWREPGDVATYPKVSQTSTKSGMNSTRFLYSMTKFNLSTFTLTWTLPRRWLDRLKMDSLSLSLTGYNVYLFTPDQSRTLNSYKTLSNGFPVNRNFTLGLNASF